MSTSKPPCPAGPHLPMDCPADWHNPGEVTHGHWPRPSSLRDPGPISLQLADDERNLPQLAQVGILSTADREVMRRLSGDLTLAEWMTWPAERRAAMPWRPDTRLTLVMGARVQAVQQARLMARVAPSAFIRAVR